MREMLKRLLLGCSACKAHLEGNIALTTDGPLSDDQLSDVLAYMLAVHTHHE